MAFNIEAFRTNTAKSGFLRNNKFEVEISIPVDLITNLGGLTAQQSATNAETARTLKYWCEVGQLPGISVATHEVRRYGYGPFERKPTTVTFKDINVTLLSDGNGNNWDLFQKWIQYIHNFDLERAGNGRTNTNFGMRIFQTNYKVNYATDIRIKSYDDTGKLKLHIKLCEAYPIFLGDINLSWGDTNSIMRIPLTFTFFTWTNEKTGDAFEIVSGQDLSQTLIQAQQQFGNATPTFSGG
jgi:hypothetical protein